MPTPIEELTAREMAEGSAHTTGPAAGKPIQPELVPPVVFVAPPPPAPVEVPAPKSTVSAFLHHLKEEIEGEEGHDVP
jgi:hypothetical protein